MLNQRVLLCRPEREGEKGATTLAFVASLTKLGAVVEVCALTKIVAPEDPEPLMRAARAVASYDWLLFTSAHGVRQFFSCRARLGEEERAGERVPRIACVGAETARALTAFEIEATLVATQQDGDGLAHELVATIGKHSARILFPRALRAREALPSALRLMGHTLDVVEAYRTVLAETSRPEIINLVAACHIVVLTAPSTAQALLSLLGSVSLLSGKCVASIGPSTTAALSALGVSATMTADVPSLAAIAKALAERQPPR
jgi:uroporphyrinogen III methyltransferase / synthase